jgi:hypothetical protein
MQTKNWLQALCACPPLAVPGATPEIQNMRTGLKGA